MKYGIAISTYFGENTSPQRFNIFLTSIYSLLSSGFDGKIVVVDDCSNTTTHLDKIKDISNIKCIRRPVNNGLGRCKNTCIKNLLDCEYLFIADDDNIYNGEWWSPYIDAYKQTKFSHFSHYTYHHSHSPQDMILETVNGANLKNHRPLNGNFLFMTNNLITEIGGFKIMPYKYGFEHTNFSIRCLKSGKIPFYYDVAGSENHIWLNKSSHIGKSMQPDIEKARLNLPSLNNPKIYEPLEE